MTIRLFLLLPLLVLAACASPRGISAPESRTAEPIFRYVNLGPLGRFELGEPFGNSARLAVSEGPNTYRLRDEAFGGAESIVVTTDNGEVVRRISFEYGPGYGWAEKLSNYTASLGPPARVTGTEAVWNDGRTEFKLSRDRGALYAARAEMRDLTGSS